MSHIDDGLLHAYLDGALHAEDPAEAERVERHLAVCDDCRARLEAARGVRAEADVLLEAATPTDLDMPPFETIAARARRRAADAGEKGERGTIDAATDADGHVVPAARTTRRRPYTLTRTLAWAASIVIALGMGWWARELAFQPGGLPHSRTQQLDRAPQAPQALEAAAPAAKTTNAAESPAAPVRAENEAAAAATQPTTAPGRGTAADQQAAGVAGQKSAAGLAAAAQPSKAAATERRQAPATEQPKAPTAEQPKAPAAEARARKVEAALAAPSANAPVAVKSNAVGEMAPSIATDAAMQGANWSGTRVGFLTVDQARAWLGGPAYGVEGLDVVGVVSSIAPDGARAVTVYQRLSGSDTLGLHQLRPASGNAFTLGPGVTGVIRDGTLIYARTALPPDSLQALLRRLVPLRR